MAFGVSTTVVYGIIRGEYLSVSRAIMADPSILDVREHNQGDDEPPPSTEGDVGGPVSEGTPDGIFRWID